MLRCWRLHFGGIGGRSLRGYVEGGGLEGMRNLMMRGRNWSGLQFEECYWERKVSGN